MNFRNKKVAILGWGINGMDAFNFLKRYQADITIFDNKEEEELDFNGINIKKDKLVLGSNYLNKGLSEYDYVIRAPGVYRNLPEILEAENKGTIITSVVKLFFDICPANIIGVTGTKGKGTTSTLIYEIMKNDGRDVCLAGNIGLPMLELLPKLTKESFVVLELSSFQLIDADKSPHIAVVLNVTEDHLDWHRDRPEYVEAKKQIVKHQTLKDYAVINYDFKTSRDFSKSTKAKKYYFSKTKRVKGCYVLGDDITLEIEKDKYVLGKTNYLLLRGKHNWENVCASACASFIAGAGIDSIKRTVYSFKGLEHRLEIVGEIDGIKLYNDSFSTNPQTTIAAINSFDEPITLILGGSDKSLNYDRMSLEIVKSPNVKNIILIGEISDIIEKSLVKAEYKESVFKLEKKDMRDIIEICIKVTSEGGVILLSPATASFDMFKDYKDRGNKFKEAFQFMKKELRE